MAIATPDLRMIQQRRHSLTIGRECSPDACASALGNVWRSDNWPGDGGIAAAAIPTNWSTALATLHTGSANRRAGRFATSHNARGRDHGSCHDWMESAASSGWE